MKTLLPKPFRGAAVLFLLTSVFTCWLPLGALAQRSEWYGVAKSAPVLGGLVLQCNPMLDDAGNAYHGYIFTDSMQLTHLPPTDTTIRWGSAPGQYECCVASWAPNGRRRWVWRPAGGTSTRWVRVLQRASATSILALVEIGGGSGRTFIAGTDTLQIPANSVSGMALVKLNLQGQVEWARLVAHASSTFNTIRANDMTIDATGHILIAALYAGDGAVAQLPLPARSVNQAGAFLARLDSTGVPQWVQVVSGANESQGDYVCADATGNVYFSGRFLAQVSIGGIALGVTGAHANQLFVAKYSATGQVQWARAAGSTTGQTCSMSRPAVHPSGDLLLRLYGPQSAFGTSYSSSNLLRVQPNGTVRWQRPFVGGDISCDRLGNIYATGNYNSFTTNLPALGNGIVLPPVPTSTSAVTGQGTLIMYDNEAVPQWAMTVACLRNGSLTLRFPPLITSDGHVYVGGGLGYAVVLGTDTLRVPQSPIGMAWQYLWKVRPPLTFGEAGQRLVCAGATYRVPFTRDSTRFAAGQAVVAELSDATGSFTTPTVIDSATGAAERDTLTLTIPATATPGAGYRVRLKTSAPYLLSAGEGLALEITPAAVARILAPDTVGVCPSAPFPVLRGQASFGSALQWTRNGQPLPGATTDRLPLTQPGTYALTVSGGPCGAATSPSVEVLPVSTPTLTLAPLGQVLLTGASFALTGATPAGGSWSGPGVSNNRFTPATAGLGTHTLTYNYTSRYGCAATATITIDVVRVLGVGEEAGVQALTLSPNPAQGVTQLTFRTQQRQPATIALYDALGRLVQAQTLPADTEHATMLPLPAVTGVYQVRVVLATGVVTRRLLVQP